MWTRRSKINLKPLIPFRCVCVCLSNFVFQSGILIIVKRERVYEKCTYKKKSSFFGKKKKSKLSWSLPFWTYTRHNGRYNRRYNEYSWRWWLNECMNKKNFFLRAARKICENNSRPCTVYEYYWNKIRALCLSFFLWGRRNRKCFKNKKRTLKIFIFLCVDDFFAFIIIISLLLLSYTYSMYVFFFYILCPGILFSL